MRRLKKRTHGKKSVSSFSTAIFFARTRQHCNKMKRKDYPTANPRVEKKANNQTVATHYDQRALDAQARPRPRAGANTRAPLLDANNWVKGDLLSQVLRPGQVVLELGCGRGGDLNKMERAQVRQVVARDLSEQSVREYRRRHQDAQASCTLDAQAADCFTVPLHDVPVCDVASCQMALHYAFTTEAHAETALRNVAEHLRPGGSLAVTAPDADVILRRLTFHNAQNGLVISPILPEFGGMVRFLLPGAVEDCPEPLMGDETLRRVAARVGLVAVSTENFRDYITRRTREDSTARKAWVERYKLKLPLSRELASNVGLYRTWIFQRAHPAMLGVHVLDDALNRQRIQTALDQYTGVPHLEVEVRVGHLVDRGFQQPSAEVWGQLTQRVHHWAQDTQVERQDSHTVDVVDCQTGYRYTQAASGGSITVIHKNRLGPHVELPPFGRLTCATETPVPVNVPQLPLVGVMRRDKRRMSYTLHPGFRLDLTHINSGQENEEFQVEVEATAFPVDAAVLLRHVTALHQVCQDIAEEADVL
jgi:mRNA (guanine-N7-)-methyltransferase